MKRLRQALEKLELKESNINTFPSFEGMFNCNGDYLFFLDGKLVGKQKKDGTYIDFTKTKTH